VPAEARREGDGADREQEGARGEAEDMVAALGGGSEGAKQLDRSQHQEEQGKDHSPGDGTFGGEYSSGLRGGRDRQEAGDDNGREALHGSITAKRDRMGVPSVSTKHDIRLRTCTPRNIDPNQAALPRLTARSAR
jgi:hypothetical protein